MEPKTTELGMIGSLAEKKSKEEGAAVMDTMPEMDTKPLTKSEISGLQPLGIARFLVNLFSRFDKQRDPPSPRKSIHLQLITIGPSQYCEKARWGLDLLEQDDDNPYYYTEDAHPPGFHSFRTIPITGGAYSTTPLILFPDGSYLAKSDHILSEMCPFLYPAEIAQDVKNFEIDMGIRLGATVRCLYFYYMLNPGKEHYAAFVKQQCCGLSRVETILFEGMFDKGIDQALRKTMKFNDETAKTSLDSVNRVMAEISDRLDRNGGEYIFDTPEKKYGFTAADLTFAAMVVPVIPVEQISDWALPMDEAPLGFVQLVQSLQQTTAGKHCQKLYQKDRPLFSDGKVHLKKVNRDRNPFQQESWLYAAGAAGIILAGLAATFWAAKRNQ